MAFLTSAQSFNNHLPSGDCQLNRSASKINGPCDWWQQVSHPPAACWRDRATKGTNPKSTSHMCSCSMCSV